MSVRDYKISTANKVKIYSFGVDGKVRGSKLENPIVITKNGLEISQEEYDKLKRKDGTAIDGVVEVAFNISALINNVYGGSYDKLYEDLKEIDIPSLAIFDNTKNKYDYYLRSDVVKDFYKFIDHEGVIKVKSSKNPTKIELSLTMKNEEVFKSNILKSRVEKNCSMFLQGLTIPNEIKDDKEYSLLNIISSSKGGINIDFSSKEIPKDARQSDKGVSIDEYSHDVPVLQFNNSGINSSKGIIEFDLNLEDTTDIGIEFYVSSEARYDKFYIYLDDTVRLCISGDTSGNTSIENNVDEIDGLKACKWSIYTLKGVTSGKHTLKLEYKKDSSSYAGDDNVYIKRIFSGNSSDCSLILKDNEIKFTQNSNIISSINVKELRGQTLDILINNKDTCNLYILKDNEVSKSIGTENISLFDEADITLLGTNKDTTIDALLDAFYVINSDLSVEEIENILKGKEKGFERPLVLDKIKPNEKYIVNGIAILYQGNIPTRQVEGEFTAKNYEERILLLNNSTCKRV